MYIQSTSEIETSFDFGHFTSLPFPDVVVIAQLSEIQTQKAYKFSCPKWSRLVHFLCIYAFVFFKISDLQWNWLALRFQRNSNYGPSVFGLSLKYSKYLKSKLVWISHIQSRFQRFPDFECPVFKVNCTIMYVQEYLLADVD